MAITIINQPPEISFSRNPNWWGFKTDNLYSNAGQASVVLLAFPLGPMAENGAFDLTYNGKTQTFTVKNYPDDSGLQILSGKDHPLIADLTLLAWCNLVIAELKGNFLLSRDFVIELDLTGVDPRVKLTAKVADPKYDLTLSTGASMNLALLSNGVKKSRHPSFGIWMQILVSNEDNTGFDVVMTDTFLDVNDEGEAFPNLSQTLTQSLIGANNEFEQPDPVLPALQRNYKTCRKYYLRFGEAYGSTQVIKKISTTDTKWVMLGGIGKSVEENYSIPVNFYVDGVHRFLKQEALTKNVALNQPEWLSLVWLTVPVAVLKFHIKVYFTEGLPAEVDAFTTADVAKYDKIIFPSGPTQLNLSGLYPDKIVSHYEAWLTDGANVRVSEIRTYQLNYDYQPYAKFISALSSLGGYDTFYLVGKGSKEYELISQRAAVTKTSIFKFEEGETFEFDSKLDHKETVLTGWLTKRELKRYRDFFLSWNKFQVKNGRSYPIMLNSKSIKELKEGENLFALEFEIGYRFSEQAWTEEDEDALSGGAIDVSQFWPPVSTSDPANYDAFYYRKTQTYNKAEVDAFIVAVVATETANHAAQQGLIDALQLALVGKSNTDHLHPGVYVPVGEYNEFVVAVGAALIQKGAWDPIYTVDPLDPGVLPGYSIDNLVDHDLKQWRSLVDENTSEPGTDPLKWVLVLNDISDVETATDRTWSSQKIVDTHYNKTQSDLRYAALSHTHIIANVTGLQAELDGKAALSHTHVIANVTGLQAALDAKAALVHTHVIGDITGLQSALDAKEALANKNVANGYAGLDGAGLIPSSLLPSYVDDVLEYANLASLPVSGVSSKIYVTLDTNKTYRWSGSGYTEISASPGSTDAVPEGSVNLYHTPARVQAIGDARYPLLNGTGATGTWGINISGNASTATLAANSTLWGGVAYGGPYATTASLTGYLPLTGGTLSGTLAGTSANFTSTLNTNTKLQIGGWDAVTWTNTNSILNIGGSTAAQWQYIDFYTGGMHRARFDSAGGFNLYGGTITSTTGGGSFGGVLTLGNALALQAVFNSTHTSGGYAVFQKSGVAIGYIGNSAQLLAGINTDLEVRGNSTLHLTAPADVKIYSRDALAATFGVSGNLGIGITPVFKLDVAGDIRYSGYLYAPNGSAANASIRFYNSASGMYYPGADDLGFTTNATSRYVISMAGNHDFKTGTATFGGTINTNAETAISATNAGADRKFGYWTNTSGGFLWGMEGVNAGSLITGSSAYAAVLGTLSSTSVQIGTGGIVRVTISSTGATIFNSTVTASGGFFNSDERWKNFNNRTFDLSGLEAGSFRWNKFSEKDDGKNHYGWKAQDVQKYMPDAVQADSNGFLSVNYTEVLVAKVQRLEEEVRLLKTKLVN